MKNAQAAAGTSARQATLERFFEVVDLIKDDLNQATSVGIRNNRWLMLNVKSRPVFWLLCDGQLIRNGLTMIAAKEFFVSHFPDANSVLYRIGLENGEQIRGYIFLTNVVK